MATLKKFPHADDSQTEHLLRSVNSWTGQFEDMIRWKCDRKFSTRWSLSRLNAIQKLSVCESASYNNTAHNGVLPRATNTEIRHLLLFSDFYTSSDGNR